MTDNDVKRAEFIKAVREFATFLEEHPTVGVPDVPSTVNVWVTSKDEMTAHARATSWKKAYYGSYFCLSKTFGEAIQLDIVIGRQEVCEKVVTGTRVIAARPEHTEEIIEWRCTEPLLSGE